MKIKSDIQIAQETEMKDIREIARSAGLDEKYIELYGNYKAKVDYRLLDEKSDAKDGKVILVTAISPTPAGEGKTTTTVGLSDALKRAGKNVLVALREPSLGPVFGVKGGAAGGGYAQVVPMEDINLHFTGDMHAIGAANNLLAAMLDNHIQQGNSLGIDVRKITWKRCVDMNDRQLRFIIDGLGGKANGTPREDGFDITVASEIMAILCLARDIDDLKERISNIIVGYNYDDEPVTAGQLKAQGAMAALLKDALKPNLVQTLGAYTGVHSRRSFRQHSPRVQFGDGNEDGDENGGLCCDRSRFRCRSWRGEIPGYKMQDGRYKAFGCCSSCNSESPQTSWRRS